MALTEIQYVRAKALANRHGHEWAGVDGPEREPEEIAERTRRSEGHDPSMPGIAAPWLNVKGVVEHSTGTGRAHWAVHPNGLVEICISRPRGDCLRARVSPQGEASYSTEGCCERVLTRHIDALSECFAALGLPNPAMELWAAAISREKGEVLDMLDRVSSETLDWLREYLTRTSEGE